MDEVRMVDAKVQSCNFPLSTQGPCGTVSKATLPCLFRNKSYWAQWKLMVGQVVKHFQQGLRKLKGQMLYTVQNSLLSPVWITTHFRHNSSSKLYWMNSCPLHCTHRRAIHPRQLHYSVPAIGSNRNTRW